MDKTISVQDLRPMNLTCNETWLSPLKYLVTLSLKRALLYPASKTFCLWPWLGQCAVHQNKGTVRRLHLSFLSFWKLCLCLDEREALTGRKAETIWDRGNCHSDTQSWPPSSSRLTTFLHARLPSTHYVDHPSRFCDGSVSIPQHPVCCSVACLETTATQAF